MRFDEFVEAALYDSESGFYERGGSPGRGGGDFITSPEVGPLFGAVLARALDAWWAELGRPEVFTVVEAGAGPGTLARSVAAAGPECAAGLRYMLVERSAVLRARHPEGFESLSTLATESFDGVILANELLDNLPFRLLERTGAGWTEVHVELDPAEGSGYREVLLPAEPETASEADQLAPDAEPGARIPLQHAARDWLVAALDLLNRGRVVVFDYADATPSMASRPWTGWVRTYRAHGRGGHPVDDPGRQDITCEVAVDQLSAVRPPASDRSQAEFLRAHGIDGLAAEARRAWQERAHIGDLQALTARSRANEAAALTDPAGLGAFRVLEWLS